MQMIICPTVRVWQQEGKTLAVEHGNTYAETDPYCLLYQAIIHFDPGL